MRFYTDKFGENNNYTVTTFVDGLIVIEDVSLKKSYVFKNKLDTIPYGGIYLTELNSITELQALLKINYIRQRVLIVYHNNTRLFDLLLSN